jgi:6-pyruvoyltetrahydropterin/6-carboxytetrahydropterin synthase
VKLSLSRRYLFSASHRLHSDQLDQAENRRVYGKCNNPYGHGHNYVVEVTITGPVDAANLADLDPYVNEHVLEVFDHKFLNEEIPQFRAQVPTTENLCIEIFRRLKGFPAARLQRVRVEETGRNSFEYDEDA